jgi:hypothetical protein
LRKIRRHIICCSLAGLILIPLLSILFLQLWQIYLQHTVKERMESHSLQTITIPVSEFSWYKEGKEIKVGDDLFDVKSYVLSDDEIILTGIFDKEEKAIHDFLAGHSKNSKPTNALLQILLLSQIFITILFNPNFILAFLKRCFQVYFNHLYQSIFLKVITPPPNFSFSLY